jgi:hypothetical protein
VGFAALNPPYALVEVRAAGLADFWAASFAAFSRTSLTRIFVLTVAL